MDFFRKVLDIRDLIRLKYRKFQFVIDPVLKFILVFIGIHRLDASIGFNARLASLPVEIIVALIGAVVPVAITILLFGLIAIVQVFSASPVLALLAILIFAVLYCFLARFSGKYGYAIVAIPILYTFNIPYIVPLVLGMTANPIAAFPAACGVVIYNLIEIIKEVSGNSTVKSLDDALELYISVIDKIITRKEMFVAVGVFAFVIIAMWFIRKIRFEYVFELTVVLGTLINILGFAVAFLVFNIGGNMGGVLLGSIFSLVIALIVQFFRYTLDYTGVQRVQFEDDDYYYYVNAVPKFVGEVEAELAKQGNVDYTVELDEEMQDRDIPSSEENPAYESTGNGDENFYDAPDQNVENTDMNEDNDKEAESPLDEAIDEEANEFEKRFGK
ncbi:MAG: hypothetical protein K6B75_08870 [Lachnospiraceae bacterium]|nr:hypothetical protein [Lachnospiraceae bacterium]